MPRMNVLNTVEREVRNVLERLAAIRREKILMAGVQFDKVTVPQIDQQKILDYLQVSL